LSDEEKLRFRSSSHIEIQVLVSNVSQQRAMQSRQSAFPDFMWRQIVRVKTASVSPETVTATPKIQAQVSHWIS